MKKLSMLEYSKKILNKVSFNRQLFWKEYKKSMRLLGSREANDLRAWLIVNYLPERGEKKVEVMSQILQRES